MDGSLSFEFQNFNVVQGPSRNQVDLGEECATYGQLKETQCAMEF